MSPFVVHTIPGSPYARAVLAVLEEKGAPWRVAALSQGDARREPHLRRHPFGRMPVLEHDGFVLYETQAILRHLERTMPRPALIPPDPYDAARMDQILNINDWYLFQGVANVIVWQRVVGPKVLGPAMPVDERAIEEALPRAATVLGELSRLLGARAFLAGTALSLADLMVAPQLDFFAEAPEWPTLTRAHPNLVSWLARMRDRPSMQATTWARVAQAAAA